MNTPATPRLPLIDSAKGVLVLLVIWGHLIERAASNSPSLQMMYGAVYLFHIPAFVFIAGMHSRPDPTRAGLLRIARKLLLPLVVFQALYWPINPAASSSLVHSFTTPIWILWFLLSLAFWQIVLPYFLRLPAPLLIALALAVLAGFADWIGRGFSTSRSFYFFPAFMLGHLYGRRLVAFAQANRALCLAGFIAVITLGLLLARDADFVVYLYGRNAYSALPPLDLHPALVRLACIFLGLGATIGFFALIPKGAGWLARIGAHTLPIYLIHGAVVIILWPLLARFDFGAAATAGASALIAAGLAWGITLISERKARKTSPA